MSTQAEAPGLNAYWQSDKNVGKDYARFEDITVVPATAMLKRCGLLDVVGAAELKILDNACGNGIVTETLLKSTAADTASWDIVLADFSPSMIEQAKARVESNGWKSATTVIADMQDMKDFKDGQFTHVVTNFEIRRVLEPGGVNAFTTWLRPGWVDAMQEILHTIPEATLLPSFDDIFAILQHGNLWQRVDFVQTAMQNAGFVDVDVSELSTAHTFPVDDFIKLATGPMMNGIVRNFWTEEQVNFNMSKLPDGIRTFYANNPESKIIMHAIIAISRKPRT
ncbi:hypothetical protein EMMF5_004829 [Cystobasidiomycetes sp. EMM_F5]